MEIKKNNLSKKLYLLAIASILLSISVLINSCEDPVPVAYVQQTYVQGFLLVDSPIQNILIMNSQPVTDSFNIKTSIVKDATVKITGDGREFDLVIDTTGTQGYYFPDSTYLVKSGITYKLEIKLKNNTLITGETTTPIKTQWIEKTPYFINYPKDTIKLPPLDSVKLHWDTVHSTDYYLISVRCLDTLYYGKYLSPPTNEMNRRIGYEPGMVYRPRDVTSWNVIPTTQTPIVWNVFKWYGLQEVSIYAPDYNYLRWFIQYIENNQYNPLLSSVKGGIGVFGSASVIRDTSFLIKNQP